MINRMLSWLNGLSKETIDRLCREVFQECLVKRIRPEIIASLDRHRLQQGEVVLLSSATAPICHPVSDHLKFDQVICTHLETINGTFTGRTEGKLVYGLEKRNRMFTFCREHRYDPREAFYYGDSHTDQHVMKAVGKPVAVSPDSRLLKIALSNNWPILVQDR
jgi:HAD superfamily phosphoserine phosphatase-like hydrolase